MVDGDGAPPVLVIDDDDDIRLTIGGILEDVGYRVLAAGSAQAALEVLRGGAAPRLILLDLSMPVMDGAGFRKEQVKDARLAKIPTLVLTAAANPLERVAPLGVQGYIEKPFDLDVLIARVKQFAGDP